jgi:hypothetical protein
MPIGTHQRDQFLGSFSHQSLRMPTVPLTPRRRALFMQPTVEDCFHQLSAHGLTALDHLLFQSLQLSLFHLAHLFKKGFQFFF